MTLCFVPADYKSYAKGGIDRHIKTCVFVAFVAGKETDKMKRLAKLEGDNWRKTELGN